VALSRRSAWFIPRDRKIPLPQSILILPKRYPVPAVALPGAMKYQQGGVALASNVGLSDEFVSLWEYGAVIPTAHSLAEAPRCKPIVKEFEDNFRAVRAGAGHVHRPAAQRQFRSRVGRGVLRRTVLTQESLLDLLFVVASLLFHG
jgi:hypothetical protein